MPKGPSKSTVIIQRLLEERRQYEAWIARLNDSADATPGHVRARVRSDYEARLAAVTEELKAHAESARQAIEEKRYLRGELQKKEARAAEKLTETELRHAVGEYDESQWEQVHKEVLAELVSVREDLQSVEADIHKLQELDALVSHRPAPHPSTAAPAPPQGVRDDEPADRVVLRAMRGGASRRLNKRRRFYFESFLTAAARRDLCRAAVFRWMRFFRAARSRSCTADRYAWAAWSAEVALRTRLSAVRRAERWARLCWVCARAWRIAFLADLIRGTAGLLVRRGR